jgi:molecular chaperone GrpE
MDNKKPHKKEKNKEHEEIEEDVLQEEDKEKQLENRIKELDEQLKRAIADYRNLERRSSDERIEAIKFANKQLIEALLPAFDTLFLAEKYTTDETIKLTIGRILDVLKENGIEKIATNDAQYNAAEMECVEVVEGEKEKVIEEIRPGFKVNGRLIRPAQVKVGKGQ